MVQTVTPTKNDVIVNTVNAGRQFRVYLTSSLDILSSVQYNPLQTCLSFTYNTVPIEAKVIGFRDHRYNGWIAFFCVQSTTLLHEHRFVHETIVM